MKKTLSTIVLAAITLSLISCGGGKKDEEEVAEVKGLGGALGALAKMGKEMEKSATESKGKQAERRAKGDTLAMPYADLQKFLPVIDGYKMDEPGGGSVNMTGMSYSNAEAKYTNDKGNWIKVSIVDYNQAYSMYAAATAMWAMGMSIDTPTEKANGFKLDDKMGGWEVFQKKSKEATVTLGVGERFWVNVEANEQSGTDFVKGIAKSIDIAKLSAM